MAHICHMPGHINIETFYILNGIALIINGPLSGEWPIIGLPLYQSCRAKESKEGFTFLLKHGTHLSHASL